MRTVNPKDASTGELHGLMLGAVAPRPIAFASTISQDGEVNLAPYSFFNAFSSNPPTLIFSSNRRVRDNTTKDTLANVLSTKEVVINVVSYSIVRQMAVASIEYAEGVDEFEKAGLTPIASEMVKPFRVKESPVQFECKVKEVISLGEHGGAGNLIVCEILLMHISEDVLGDDGKIDPHKIDLCGRMGGMRYVRASGDAIFEVVQPVAQIGIGFDQLPEQVRNSTVLTGNDLGMLAGVQDLPGEAEVQAARTMDVIDTIYQQNKGDDKELIRQLHIYAKHMLEVGDVAAAWKALLLNNESH